ncbi:bifunctional 2-polyprenyl-6-hydroxyphenol methylase/3-demethylubiquinol 3-O-methyltransferase UbiG [Acidipila sp. EB88]|uniref:class I SAM-dependent methyltransferase n=1 Tax=Acidipila sp. EB88 TaxID=2305226 RepID=UPI001F443828|nr:class I SAM-dependent methyltransferase [Acidipila sp. EB88]
MRASHAEDVLRFLDQPIAAQLVQQGRLIATTVTPQQPGDATDGAATKNTLVLEHPLISFISYPWEWPPHLWLQAAELTLDLAADLLKHGWTIKDATPLNVLFEGVRPVFIDLLSIEPLAPQSPIWLAYGQFIRTFLLPMLAHAQLGWPLAATLMRRDGYEPEEVYAALGWGARLRQPALTAVTLPSLLAGKAAERNAGGSRPAPTQEPELAQHVLAKTFRNLRTQMRRTVPARRASNWSHYASTATHYHEGDHAAKRTFVGEVLSAGRPGRVLDVGCNTGVYSRIAAETGASVISIDTDLEAVDRLAASLAKSELSILPLCVDLAHPTPAIGWENREQRSFLARCEGYFDLVMMLAVIHHLLVGSQIPLDRIAALCASITTRHLIVEWVPLADPKFQQILRGRDAIYAHLTEDAFRSAFRVYFAVERECLLENGRILFHYIRHPA